MAKKKSLGTLRYVLNKIALFENEMMTCYWLCCFDVFIWVLRNLYILPFVKRDEFCIKRLQPLGSVPCQSSRCRYLEMPKCQRRKLHVIQRGGPLSYLCVSIPVVPLERVTRQGIQWINYITVRISIKSCNNNYRYISGDSWFLTNSKLFQQ